MNKTRIRGRNYYVERMFEDGSFNIWRRIRKRYFCVATLFYQDPLCGNQWTTDEPEELEKVGAYYTPTVIKDEIESPLKPISNEELKKMTELTSLKDISIFLSNFYPKEDDDKSKSVNGILQK